MSRGGDYRAPYVEPPESRLSAAPATATPAAFGPSRNAEGAVIIFLPKGALDDGHSAASISLHSAEVAKSAMIDDRA